MLLYYDPSDGRVLHTLSGSPKTPPPGAYIEAPDDTDTSNLAALSVVDGLLVVTPIPITSEQVNDERARRMDMGVIVTVSGYGDVALQGRDTDKISLSGLKDVAVMRMQAGDTTTSTKFRDRDNVDHFLTPPQIVELWQHGIAWLEGIYNRSWDLKSMAPIPFDYEDDGYWT